MDSLHESRKRTLRGIMYDFRKFPLLRALIPFFGGVVCGTALIPLTRPEGVLFLSLSLLVLALFMFFWQGGRKGSGLWLLSLILFLLLFIAGAGNAMLTRPRDPGLPVGERVLVRGEVTGSPLPGPHGFIFDMQVYLVFSGSTSYPASTLLKTYLRIPADSLVRDESPLPAAGELWQFSGKLVTIRNNGNPGGIDFKSHMNRNNCWYRFYVSTGAEAVLCNRQVSGQGRRLSASRIRKRLSDHWQGEAEEVSLLKAVCLGDRSSLSDELRQSYKAAGGMHLLAVSGLHVGLIWWVLQYMTGWMHLIFRSEKLKTVLLVGLLWFYAFVTGFSSSVSRSVCMFSFFSAGRLWGERTHPLNGIFVSAFILVLLKPARLMDLGFQLSYMAVSGIVSLYPLLKVLPGVKNPFLRWIWEATFVSLSAQLSTAPLVIYYFHQLPIYSLITSMIAIPLLSVMICIFVCSVPFISAGILEEFFSFLLIKLARLMNRCMDQISDLPGALLEGLHLDRAALLFWLLLLVLGLITLHVRSRTPRYLVLLLISVFLIWSSGSRMKCQGSSELLITHFTGASMLIFREGARLDFYCWYRDRSSMEYMQTYRDLAWSRRRYQKLVNEVDGRGTIRGNISGCVKLEEGLWLLGNDNCAGLVISKGIKEHTRAAVFEDSAGLQNFRPDFILLSGEPEVQKLSESMCGDKVDLVLDGSNRNWYKEKMALRCERAYLTDRSGAYMKRW